MSMKILTAALLTSALVSASALAQSSPPAGSQSSPPAASQSSPPAASSSGAASTSAQASQTQSMKSGQWRTSKLIGLNVYNNNNEKIGDINELITDQSGKIDMVVIGAGGFLGIGEHNVALPFNQVKFSDQPRQNTTASGNRPAGGGTTASGTATSPAPSGSSSTTQRDYPDHAMVNMSKDQLKAMPAFRYASDTRSDRSNAGAPARTAPAGQPAQQR
jgi:sporulation protein YlmC with PRC-barrel domain